MKRALLAFLAAVAAVSYAFPLPAAQDTPKNRVIAYYFYGAVRCPTCLKLEQYSQEALETNCKDALGSGRLEFKAIDVEKPGNEHYVTDYQLYTKSLVLSRVQDGKELESKNLTKIWEYVRNKQTFIDYVSTETNSLLEKTP